MQSTVHFERTVAFLRWATPGTVNEAEGARGGERIQALVESQPGLDSSAGIDTGGPHQARQQRRSDDGAAEQRPEKRNLGGRKEKK